MSVRDTVREQRARKRTEGQSNSDAEKIKQKIAELLDKPIVPSELKLDSCGFRSPHAQYINKPLSDPCRLGKADQPQGRPLDLRREELCRILERGLGHFAANPSRPGNVRALRAIYTFPERKEKLRSDFPFQGIPTPNKNEESACKFILQLAALAQQNRELTEARYHGRVSEQRDLSTERTRLANDSKWVLVGDRGVGKTIFVNYAFTVFNQDLHNKRTIWVRIDYTKDKLEPLDLGDWIRWKICHTLYRWYEAQNRETDAEKFGRDNPDWQHWKEKTDKDMVFDLSPGSDVLFDRARLADPEVTREEFEREVREARNQILSEEDAGKVKPWLFQAIWDHLAVDHKVAFIIVIDGLDRLGLTDADRERFERKVNEIRSEIRTEKALAAAYLLTARYESYCEHFVEEQLKGFRLARILPVSAKAIWERKKTYLQSPEILPPECFPHVQSMSLNQYQALQDLLCDSLMAFASYALTSTWSDKPTSDCTKGFDLLEGIFGDNVRLMFAALAASARFLMTALPESFDSLLDSAVASKEAQWLESGAEITLKTRRNIQRQYRRWYYRFIEALMLQSTDRHFRQDRYRYALRKGHGAKSEFRLHVEAPDEFLYNVFHHAWSETTTFRPCVLASVRAMQYARYCENVVNRDTLIEFLKDHFGYSENVLQLTLQQSLEAGVFRPYTKGEGISPAELEITLRGEFLLDRLVNALEYVCLALQTAPLPRSLVAEDLFPVRPYTSGSFVVDNKIVSTINFLRLLSDLEVMEEEHFNKHVAAQLEDDKGQYSFCDYAGKSFRLTDIMKDSIGAAINRIVDQAFRSKDKRQIAQLKDRFPS